MSTTRLPVLFLTDLVVLPGMVVPIELDDAARAAVDTAKAHSDDSLLVAPRLEDRYASYGVVAEIVQLGRLATGEAAAVIKAERRVKIGSGVSGPGTALWVEAEELPEAAQETEEIRKLAAEYKGLVIATHRLDQRRLGVRLEILNHALRHQKYCEDQTNRQQQIVSDANQVDPEIADRFRGMPRNCPNQRSGNGDARGSRDKIVKRQADHLREIRER